jgi:DNA-directed RNA polymerase subunit K/omega
MNQINSQESNNAITRNLNDFDKKTQNIYQTISVLSQRANQVSVQIRKELMEKLQNFSNATEISDEITENKEQIEAVRYYEQMPKPATVAIEEFLADKIYYRLPDEIGK